MLVCLVLLLPTSVTFAQTGTWEARFVEPDESPTIAAEGHLSLRWEVTDEAPEEAWEYQLEQSFSETFETPRTAYTGVDLGTFVSGLPHEGAYFRVRARPTGETEWGPWSPVLEVQVDYPPMWQVASLCISGLLMFGVLLGSILVGSRRTRRLSPSAT